MHPLYFCRRPLGGWDTVRLQEKTGVLHVVLFELLA